MIGLYNIKRLLMGDLWLAGSTGRVDDEASNGLWPASSFPSLFFPTKTLFPYFSKTKGVEGSIDDWSASMGSFS